MMPAPSLLLRLTRLFVGLATVWCLGCSGYETLLDSLMSNPEETVAACGSGTASSTSDEHAPTPGMTVSAASHGYECGCGQTCHGSVPVTLALTIQQLPLPHHAGFNADAPPSFARAPLLPPPESRLL